MRLLPEEVDCVIYHAPCSDGLTSALTAYLFFKDSGKKIEYYGESHGNDPPNVVGKNVLICDFSYKKNILDKMIGEAKNLLVIDHHISAKNELSELHDDYKIFDMNHSGAVLTWNYFYPDKEAPLLYKYVEDRDIWKKEMPNTDAFVSWFYNLEQTFEIYEKYLDDELLLKNINDKGLSYIELNNIYIKDIASHAVPIFTKINKKYHFVSYINSNMLKSDIGHEIFKIYPNCSFSAVYNIAKYNRTFYSLRSTNDHEDVSQIAKCFGGGGHRNASGLTLSYVSNTIGDKYDNGELYELINKGCYLQTHPIFIHDTNTESLHPTSDEIEINLEKLEIVVILYNSNIFKKEIGKYLLQNRGNKQNGAWITNTNDNIDVAIIWHYNGNKQYEKEVIYNESLYLEENKTKLDNIKKYMDTFDTYH
jgi:oligoribonuclease NrnB/cAMP/cGMP phosphodiesterase (DHH superfamily)